MPSSFITITLTPFEYQNQRTSTTYDIPVKKIPKKPKLKIFKQSHNSTHIHQFN